MINLERVAAMAGTIVERLRERRMRVWDEAKGLADVAADENRAFSAEEQGKWDSLNEEIDALDTRMKSALDTEKRAKETDDLFDAIRGPVKHANTPEDKRSEDRATELRKFLLGQSGRTYDVKPDKPVDFRALGKVVAGAVTTAAAVTVPTSFYNRLVAHLIEVSAVMQAGATVLSTSSGEVIQVPKTTAHGSAALVAEGGTIGAGDPAFGQVSLGAFKYGTLIQISRELIEDTGVDLEGYLSMQAGRAIGNLFGSHVITGAGTTQPRGITLDSTLGATGPSVANGAAVIGAPVGDSLIDLFYSVIAPYRASSATKWIIKDSTVASLRKLKDNSGGAGIGNYLWQPGLTAGSPDTILGKQVLTDPGVAAVATGAKSIIFGDISQYFIRIAGGIRFERSDDFAFNTDMVTFRCLFRADGALVDLTGAIKHFAGGTA
jgi:HK97 family phage major capsid protein